MPTTPDLGLPELSQGQANADVTFNEALVLIQALQTGAVDKDLTSPPGSPTEGDVYLINTASPTGAWAGRGFAITIFWGGSWRFVPGNNDAGTPISMGARHAGLVVYVRDEQRFYRWNGTSWSANVASATNLSISTTDRLVGRDSAGGGSAEEISVGGGIEFTGSGGIQTSAFTGDVTKSAGGTTLSIASNSLALAKLVNAAAQYNIIGRRTSGGGAWEDCTRAQLLLAGTDLANVFTVGQTINEPGSTFLPLTVQVTHDGNLGPFIRFEHVSASPAAGDQIGTFQFLGRDSAGNLQNYGDIRAVITDPTNGSEDSEFRFTSVVGGTARNPLKFGAGVYTANASDLGLDNFYAAGVVRTGQFTVATLPAAATMGAGAKAYVTDASAPAFGAAVAGGGAVGIPVYSTGAAWNVG